MRVIVLGASPNPERYSNKAVNLLLEYNHEVFPVGIKKGKINELKIINTKQKINKIHTITIYLSAENQIEYYDYIIKKIQPSRVIFNPGTENKDFINKLNENNIETIEHCTLVMLNNNIF